MQSWADSRQEFSGIPRPTYDVDFTLAVSRDLLPELFDAAEKAGYHVPVAYRSGWVDTVAGMPIVKLGMQLGSQGIDIDVFLAESTFQESILTRRSEHDIGGKRVYLVSPEDLIVLKVLANRDRDRGDVQDLLFMQGELDRSYMRHWCRNWVYCQPWTRPWQTLTRATLDQLVVCVQRSETDPASDDR